MTVELFAQLLVNGLAVGSIYVLIALGLDIILRGNGILNFAHGQIYMLGAYVFFFTFITHGMLRLNYGVALILAALAMAILGALTYVCIFGIVQRWFTPTTPLSYQLLMSAMASVGLMMILQQGTLLVFGTSERGGPSAFPEMIRFGDVTLPMERLLVILLSLAMCLGLYLLFYRTKLGKAMRAVAFDAEVSSLQGINAFRIYLLSFALGCALAGAAGAMVGSLFSITPTMGGDIIFIAFLVILVGGIGSYKGAVLGGVLMGLVLSFGYQFLGYLANVLLFVFVMVVLIFKPGGILGEELD